MSTKKYRDPVCGMVLTERTAKIKIRYEGEYFHFCSINCKRRFKRNKIKYGK